MLELSTNRKNKVNLQDYNYQQDIENRMLIADFSFFEHEVLQEIFFSPLKFSSKKLARNLGCDEQNLTELLGKLQRAKLLTVQDDLILLDKEMRKYFEFHMKRFDSDFKLDMEYLQGILRKVPIHTLPSWYAISRTSNNIFESIVEKYLLTPQTFQRYLTELNFANPLAHQIMQDVFASTNLRIASSDLIAKYNLTRELFEEIILILEFSFVCCLSYTKKDGLWLEWVTPFHEWHEYLNFFKTTKSLPISTEQTITRKRKSDFAFAEDLNEILNLLKASPLPSQISSDKKALRNIGTTLSLPMDTKEMEEEALSYLSQVFEKASLVSLVEIKNGHLQLMNAAEKFLNMSSEKKALYLYRHPLNHVLGLPREQATEKKIREAEKSIKRVLQTGWVFFDDFIKGTTACISDHSSIQLKRLGKSWKYELPTYTETDQDFLKIIILQWLFEAGITAPGKCQGRDCFTVTAFGRYFFEE